MTKKFLFFALFVAVALPAFSQTETTEKKKGRPDIPGTFTLDLGFNSPTEKENFNTNMFGSRTLNFYYFYDKQLGNSKFSVHPGIGVGLDRFKFNNGRTLAYRTGPTMDTLKMVPASSIVGTNNIKKTQLITNYIDIPVEFRFTSNPNDPGRSFKASIGFKVGILYESFTKVKYRQDGEMKKLKDKQNFELNPFRYGVTLKAGVGNFSLFGYYNLTPLFKEGKGPNNGIGLYNDITNFTFGLSLAAF